MSQDLSTRVIQALTTPRQAAPQHSTAAMSSDEVIALTQVGYEPVSVISSSAVARLPSGHVRTRGVTTTTTSIFGCCSN